MNKLIITCAISGAEVTKKNNPAVPYRIEEMIKEAVDAYNAGASIIHIHARQDDGTPTSDVERFRTIMEGIRNKIPDVILNLTTGGSITMSAEERIQPVLLKPDMATLDCGTMNFGPEDEIFLNTERMIRDFAKTMVDQGVRVECESFDKSMLDTFLRIMPQVGVETPYNINFVLGVPAGMPARARDLSFLVDSAPKDSHITVSGIGKKQFDIVAIAIAEGLHVRVGFEDNVYLSKGVLAKNNAELVNKVVQIATILGRPVASAKESRSILSLPMR